VDASAPATVGFVDSFAQVQPGADSVLVQLKVVGGTPQGAVAVLGAAMDGHESGRAALQLGTNRTLATAVWPPAVGGANVEIIQSVMVSGLSSMLGPTRKSMTVQIVATAGATVEPSSSTMVLSLEICCSRGDRPGVRACQGRER